MTRLTTDLPCIYVDDATWQTALAAGLAGMLDVLRAAYPQLAGQAWRLYDRTIYLLGPIVAQNSSALLSEVAA